MKAKQIVRDWGNLSSKIRMGGWESGKQGIISSDLLFVASQVKCKE